jgi:hypothetical protein
MTVSENRIELMKLINKTDNIVSKKKEYSFDHFIFLDGKKYPLKIIFLETDFDPSLNPNLLITPHVIIQVGTSHKAKDVMKISLDNAYPENNRQIIGKTLMDHSFVNLIKENSKEYYQSLYEIKNSKNISSSLVLEFWQDYIFDNQSVASKDKLLSLSKNNTTSDLSVELGEMLYKKSIQQKLFEFLTDKNIFPASYLILAVINEGNDYKKVFNERMLNTINLFNPLFLNSNVRKKILEKFNETINKLKSSSKNNNQSKIENLINRISLNEELEVENQAKEYSTSKKKYERNSKIKRS